MKIQKNPSSDTFIIILFIIIIVAALGVRLVLFLRGDAVAPANINMAILQNEKDKDDEIVKRNIQEFSLLNVQETYATGTVAIQDEGTKKNIYVQATLADITSKYSYRVLFYGKELNEWKSLGVLEKNILGLYELKKEITQREMDYDELRVALVFTDRSSTTPGITILKRELRNN